MGLLNNFQDFRVFYLVNSHCHSDGVPDGTPDESLMNISYRVRLKQVEGFLTSYRNDVTGLLHNDKWSYFTFIKFPSMSSSTKCLARPSLKAWHWFSGRSSIFDLGL